MPTIVGGHHVAFTVRDADRTAKWYEDLLGMQVALRGDETPIGSVIVFRDPDNIQLEFWLPAGL
jgi:catechol-2,3-dioxygenase